MASERYAAGDDTSVAVIDLAPSEGSRHRPGLVASAADSLNPDIDSQSRRSWSRFQDGGHPSCLPNVAADAEPAEPRAMLERTLT